VLPANRGGPRMPRPAHAARRIETRRPRCSRATRGAENRQGTCVGLVSLTQAPGTDVEVSATSSVQSPGRTPDRSGPCGGTRARKRRPEAGARSERSERRKRGEPGAPRRRRPTCRALHPSGNPRRLQQPR
jgi:hypothetical protein